MSVVLHGIAVLVTGASLIPLFLGELVWWGTCLAIATVLLNLALYSRNMEIR